MFEGGENPPNPGTFRKYKQKGSWGYCARELTGLEKNNSRIGEAGRAGEKWLLESKAWVRPGWKLEGTQVCSGWELEWRPGLKAAEIVGWSLGFTAAGNSKTAGMDCGGAGRWSWAAGFCNICVIALCVLAVGIFFFYCFLQVEILVKSIDSAEFSVEVTTPFCPCFGEGDVFSKWA